MLADDRKYSPKVQHCKLDSDTIDVANYNELGYKTIFFGLTADNTTDFTSNTTFYELVYGVTAGALDTAPTIRAANMSKVTNYEFKLKYSQRWAEVVFRNNDLVPVDITLTLWKCIKNTSNAAYTIYDNAQDDQYHAEVNRTNTFFDSMTNYKGVIHEGGWKMIGKSIKFRLNPGDEYKWSKKLYGCVIDYNMYNSTTTYQQEFTYGLTMRTQGCICHDTTDTSLVGYSKHQIDYVARSKRVVQCSHRQGLIHGKLQDNLLDTVTTGAITMADVATENPL